MDFVWLIFLFTLGACVGSFLNVVIHRVPRRQSIVFPGSHCPSCGRAIRWYDNIPLLSWLLLRARCRHCGAQIAVRYILVEAATALLWAGLFAWYFLLDLRAGAGSWGSSWPMYVAHAVLLSGLLACALVDVEHWIVPLEVCWFVSIVGVIAATAAPHPFLATVSPATGAAAVGGGLGLIAALVLLHYGVLRPSFLDADDKPHSAPATDRSDQPGADRSRHKDRKRTKGRKSGKGKSGRKPKPKRKPEPIRAVAVTSGGGVDPRKEVLWEVAFLLPALVLAATGYLLVAHVPAAGQAWGRLVDPPAGLLTPYASALLAAVFGYLVGGLWIWGTRIGGTLAFGKEAMGMGDVHILAAVGAVTGWVVPSVAFFVAPLFGLAWALYLWLGRKQKELPYGPWLGAASLVVILFYDWFARVLAPYSEAARALSR